MKKSVARYGNKMTPTVQKAVARPEYPVAYRTGKRTLLGEVE